jgi:ketosteroid isomerase-like protein
MNLQRRRAFALSLLAVLAGSGTAAAQFPGGALESMDANRYEFMSRKRVELDAFMSGWQLAWNASSLDEVRRLYTLDAFVLHPGGRVTLGPEAVDTVAGSGSITEAMTAITDFEVSDYIAFVYGPYALNVESGRSATGTAASVMISDGRSWFLRSQLFMEDTAGDRPDAPPARPYELSGGLAEEFQRRYADAHRMIAELRNAWNDGDSARAARLFGPRALVKLPGDAHPLRGVAGVAELTQVMSQLGNLDVVVLDFDSRARISYLLGRYYLDAAGSARTGSFMAVLSREGRALTIRALLLD